MRNVILTSVTVLFLAALAGQASAQQPLSGGASDGGAIQGGSGAPGSGTGIPGAIVNNTTAQGIGEDDTRSFGQSTKMGTDQPHRDGLRDWTR